MIIGLSKTFRLTVQSLMLGIGAYLAIHKQISAGMVVAGSILLGRALAPLDLMIGTWRGFLAAREAYARLNKLLDASPSRSQPMALPAPAGAIRLEAAVIIPPGAAAPVLKGLSLHIEPGTQVAIIGPSGSGKTTLIRAMLGLHRPRSGSIRLDGAEIDQWDRTDLGQHVGYLPQDVELLEGTIGENSARFGVVDPEKVVAAARAAGIHELVLRLPDGYDTSIVGQAGNLSAGQRQRVGIARALYGDPMILAFDEPNSNLDQDGEAALSATLADLKLAGRTVLLVTHRTHVLQQVDKILLLVEGQVARYGPRAEVLAALRSASAPALGTPHISPVRSPAVAER